MRSVEYKGHIFYEDGTIVSPHGTVMKHRARDNRAEIRLNLDGKRRSYTVSRLLYYVFNPFDMEDKNLCVSYKDGNGLNVHLDNLYLAHRKDLIQGENHRKRVILSDEQIEEIKNSYKGKAGSNQYNKESPSLQDLAIKYGVTKANIKMIVKGLSRNPENYKLK